MTIQMILDDKGDRMIALSHSKSIAAVAKVLAAERVGSVILVDDAGDLAGILSERDIVRFFADDHDGAAALRAADVMTHDVVTCTADTPIEHALELMSAHSIRHIPVVRGRAPVGLVSVRDLLSAQRVRMLSDLERSSELQRNLIESQRQLELQSRNLEDSAQHLAEARDKALAANRAKSEFLATMSHELRTPLNAIIGLSQVIKAGDAGPQGSTDYEDFVDEIHGAGLHLLSLIDDVLDLAKIEAGTPEMREGPVDVAEVVHSISSMLRNQSNLAGVEVRLQLDDGLPGLRADPHKIRQIVTNLLSNAIKFTERGGIVTIRVEDRPDSSYSIEVEDTGIGIAPENVPKALSQFGQVDGALNRRHEGTGLGLPLTRALVELHGGTFELQSQIGVGTRVTARFPRWRVLPRDRDGSAGGIERVA